MTRIQINGSDTGILRLFKLDLPREAVERFTTQAGTGEWPLKYALGATTLRPGFVDVIDLRDLGPMPLSQYLAEAHGVTAAALRAERDRLDALEGHVIALPAQAFDRVSQTLAVAPPLLLLGTFGEAKTPPRGPALHTASAKGEGTGGPPAPNPRGMSGLLKLIVLGVSIVVLFTLAAVLR